MQSTRLINPNIVTVVGAAALLAGVLLYVFAPESEVQGWFAYAPLSGETFKPPAHRDLHAWGIALGVLGGLLLSGVIGYRIGWADSRRTEDRAPA